jgi:hypothetical protein
MENTEQNAQGGAPEGQVEGNKEQPGGKVEPAAPVALKVPKDSPLSTEHVEGLAGFAKQHQLSPTAAQAMLDREHGRMVAQMEAQKKAYQDEHAGWLTAVKADPEVGGDNLATNAELAKRATKRFASPELQNMLDTTGLGDHPEVLRLFLRLGKAMADDKVMVGTGGSEQKTAAQILYPNQ